MSTAGRRVLSGPQAAAGILDSGQAPHVRIPASRMTAFEKVKNRLYGFRVVQGRFRIGCVFR